MADYNDGHAPIGGGYYNDGHAPISDSGARRQHGKAKERGAMNEPLTDNVRRVWKEGAEDVLAHPENFHQRIMPKAHARERLRYEATLQDKEELIGALRVIIERLDRQLNPFKYIEEKDAVMHEAEGPPPDAGMLENVQ